MPDISREGELFFISALWSCLQSQLYKPADSFGASGRVVLNDIGTIARELSCRHLHKPRPVARIRGFQSPNPCQTYNLPNTSPTALGVLSHVQGWSFAGWLRSWLFPH